MSHITHLKGGQRQKSDKKDLRIINLKSPKCKKVNKKEGSMKRTWQIQ